ncbi:MFS transporter [Saccharopolyspora shandongensis]|uniref:MFS transporter n=1 Tax=Saccharopolyspora shandongensis TaxID=418495 RepID=UPI00340BC066
MTDDDAARRPGRSLFTCGLVLVIILIGLANHGLSTALPTIAADLHATTWYSAPFTVHLACTMLGTVLGGIQADRRRPDTVLLMALPVFAGGLMLAGVAEGMAVLLVARAIQGLAGGALVVLLYVLIASVYPASRQPAAFAAVSFAWMLPGLLGPATSGLITEHASWRWIFLGLAPCVLLATLLLAPALRHTGTRSVKTEPGPRAGLPWAAFGAAGGLMMLTWAAHHWATSKPLLALLLGMSGLAVVMMSLRSLLPAGMLTATPGVPLMVCANGLLFGVSFGAESYVPLALTMLHHASPVVAGLPLSSGLVGWTIGSYWQSRLQNPDRERLISAGFAILAASLLGLALSLPGTAAIAWVCMWWCVAGCGAGIVVTSTELGITTLSSEAERGRNSSALLLAGSVGQAALVGLGGAVAATGPTGVLAWMWILLVIALLTGALVLRAARR